MLLALVLAVSPASAQTADGRSGGRGGPTPPEMLTGTVQAVDGDLLRFPQGTVRLVGIDAPDRGQKCVGGFGRVYDCHDAAVRALRGAVQDRRVECVIVARDRNGQRIGRCGAPGAGDLSAFMVRSGWAFVFRSLGHDYAHLEAAAQSGRIGVWAGRAEPPWDYRSRKVGISGPSRS
ncbi:MAG TPA: thermonuclease family protein [Azospirillaceae bacterium]|nr:thermonuclease family protein [Azospirillaceae bacterium]